MAPQVLRIERRLAAPRERVFRAWEDPRDLEQWAWGSLSHEARAQVDFQVGGSFRVETLRPDGATLAFSGRFTEISAPQRLAHSLAWEAPMGYGPVPERVVVELSATVDGTRLVFTHEGDFSEAARREHQRGWESCLDALARRLAESP